MIVQCSQTLQLITAQFITVILATLHTLRQPKQFNSANFPAVSSKNGNFGY